MHTNFIKYTASALKYTELYYYVIFISRRISNDRGLGMLHPYCCIGKIYLLLGRVIPLSMFVIPTAYSNLSKFTLSLSCFPHTITYKFLLGTGQLTIALVKFGGEFRLY